MPVAASSNVSRVADIYPIGSPTVTALQSCCQVLSRSSRLQNTSVRLARGVFPGGTSNQDFRYSHTTPSLGIWSVSPLSVPVFPPPLL